MAEGTVNVFNDSVTKLLFSIFKAGDNGIPYYADWLNPGDKKDMKCGDFKSLSIGVQVQEGGRWIGGDPADKPYATAGGTVVLTIRKVCT